jgi:hypothetical protein
MSEGLEPVYVPHIETMRVIECLDFRALVPVSSHQEFLG